MWTVSPLMRPRHSTTPSALDPVITLTIFLGRRSNVPTRQPPSRAPALMQCSRSRALSTTSPAPFLAQGEGVSDLPGSSALLERQGEHSRLRVPKVTNDDGADGAWAFVPDEGVSLYTDDTTYLTFGWWLDKNAGGNPADFRAFSTASGKWALRGLRASRPEPYQRHWRWYLGASPALALVHGGPI